MSKNSLSAGLAARRAAEAAEMKAAVAKATVFLGVTESRAAFIVGSVAACGSTAGVNKWVNHIRGFETDGAELADLAIRWNNEVEREAEEAYAARRAASTAAPKPLTDAELDAKLGELKIAHAAALAAGDTDLRRAIARQINELELA